MSTLYQRVLAGNAALGFMLRSTEAWTSRNDPSSPLGWRFDRNSSTATCLADVQFYWTLKNPNVAKKIGQNYWDRSIVAGVDDHNIPYVCVSYYSSYTTKTVAFIFPAPEAFGRIYCYQGTSPEGTDWSNIWPLELETPPWASNRYGIKMTGSSKYIVALDLGNTNYPFNPNPILNPDVPSYGLAAIYKLHALEDDTEIFTAREGHLNAAYRPQITISRPRLLKKGNQRDRPFCIGQDEHRVVVVSAIYANGKRADETPKSIRFLVGNERGSEWKDIFDIGFDSLPLYAPTGTFSGRLQNCDMGGHRMIFGNNFPFGVSDRVYSAYVVDLETKKVAKLLKAETNNLLQTIGPTVALGAKGEKALVGNLNGAVNLRVLEYTYDHALGWSTPEVLYFKTGPGGAIIPSGDQNSPAVAYSNDPTDKGSCGIFTEIGVKQDDDVYLGQTKGTPLKAATGVINYDNKDNAIILAFTKSTIAVGTKQRGDIPLKNAFDPIVLLSK